MFAPLVLFVVYTFYPVLVVARKKQLLRLKGRGKRVPGIGYVLEIIPFLIVHQDIVDAVGLFPGNPNLSAMKGGDDGGLAIADPSDDIGAVGIIFACAIGLPENHFIHAIPI
jgi:hypothetical protein